MKKELKDVFDGIVEFRHAMHQIPEMAGTEFKTCAAIRKRLEGIPNLDVLPPFLGTDTVALLHGRKPGRNVTLRADIDALQITEETGVPYASKHPGYMHACGHDGHLSMLMGAAEILATRTDEFNGSIRFVWQPGEEGVAMGRQLVAADALENPRADLVTAMHGMPGLPLGKLAIRTGAMMAASCHFTITINGQGGHSSRPHEVHNPVLAACAVVNALEHLVPNRVDPQSGTVLTVCRIAGGQLANVIPDSVEITGTYRTLDQSVADRGGEEMKTIIDGVCAAYQVQGNLKYDILFPVLYNPPEATELSRQAMRATVGEEGCIELPASSMAAEDFAFYLQRYPGTYVKVGAGEDQAPLHSSRYNFPDEAMKSGIQYFVNFALMNLQD